MSDMLVGCAESCVASVGGGGLVVMGGQGLHGRSLNTVQVFDTKRQAWFLGPPLPQPCHSMSGVVCGDLVFVMGGDSMRRTAWCANISELVCSGGCRDIPPVPLGDRYPYPYPNAQSLSLPSFAFQSSLHPFDALASCRFPANALG